LRPIHADITGSVKQSDMIAAFERLRLPGSFICQGFVKKEQFDIIYPILDNRMPA
jgi:hypothetical protein